MVWCGVVWPQELMRVNHHLLNALGVGHPRCDRIVQISAEHGLPAKITGGGGGGCVITLLASESQEENRSPRSSGSDDTTTLVDELTLCGFECFEAVVGDEGVKLHSPEAVLSIETDESRL